MSILQQIREILTAPTFNAEDQTRTARLIHFILLAILCASAAFFIGVLLFSPERRNRLPLTLFFPLLVIGHLIMLRRVNVRYISISLTSLLWVGITASTLTGGGINHPGYGANIVIVGIAALLLGGRWALGFAGLSAVAGLVMIWAKNSGWIDARGTFSTTTIWLIQTMYFLVAAALIHLAARDMYRALNQVQSHEQLLLKRNRQLEEEIAQRKKVEEQNLELALERERFEVFRQLIDEISHDIKTPLTTINTSLYLLSRSDDPQKQKEKIKVIQNQTEQLKTFVQNMLTLSRLEQIPELDLMPLEVNRLLHELVEQFRPTCVEKSLNLTLSTDATRTLIDADKDEFRRVILNLLENAINYTPQGGSISVQTRNDDEKLIVAVSDTGVGISEADFPHIFDRFYRAESAQIASKSGSGLGLAIVKKIITMHGGEVLASKRREQGTTFEIRMPVLESPEGQ